MSVLLGALLDGIPESAAIGVSTIGGGGVGIAVVAAVFLSNIPEGLSSSAGMRSAGHSARFIMGMWLGVTVASTVAAAAGRAFLDGADPVVVATIQAFAAGAILTMLADTMVPEAVEHAGRLVGLLTVVGFLGVLGVACPGRIELWSAGAVTMALGHFLMAFEQTFLFAFLCLVMGCGMFKGNLASQVGSLYEPKDLRRADAFQIYYLAVNAGVITTPLVVGTLGEKVV